MESSLRHLGTMLICETCDSEVDVLDDSEVTQCRQCGIAFLIDAPYRSQQDSRSA